MAKKVNEKSGLPVGSGLFWNGNLIWAKVYVQGEEHRFSTKTIDPKIAIAVRNQRKDELEKGHLTSSALIERTTIDDLFQDYFVHLESMARSRPGYDVQTGYILKASYTKNLKPRFGDLRAAKFTTTMQHEYRTKRSKEGASQYTIDHELGYIRTAMNLGARHTPPKVNKAHIPAFLIEKRNARTGKRTGTIDERSYNLLMAHLPEYVKPVFAFCMFTATRKKEARYVLREKVEWENRLVTLRADETKSREERIVGLPQTAFDVIWRWEQETQKNHPKCRYLFHLNGKQIKSFDDAFDVACLKAGLGSLRTDSDGVVIRNKSRKTIIDKKVHWHDSRRTAVTLMGTVDGINDTDRGRVAGQTAETLGRYDQNKSADKVRRGIDAASAPAIPVSTASLLPVPVATKIDWKAELKDLKEVFDDGLLPEDQYRAAVAKVMANR